MAEMIPFPNHPANPSATAKLINDILHTSLELEIYQSMRTGHFDRVIVDFYLLPLSEQEDLKKRDPQTVCYYAEQIVKKMNLYK